MSDALALTEAPALPALVTRPARRSPACVRKQGNLGQGSGGRCGGGRPQRRPAWASALMHSARRSSACVRKEGGRGGVGGNGCVRLLPFLSGALALPEAPALPALVTRPARRCQPPPSPHPHPGTAPFTCTPPTSFVSACANPTAASPTTYVHRKPTHSAKQLHRHAATHQHG